MTTAISRDFKENFGEMVLPANVNAFDHDVQQSANMGAFKRAVNNEVQPTEYAAPDNTQSFVAQGPKEDIGSNVGGVSMALTDPEVKIPVPQSDISYLFGAACDSVSQVINPKPDAGTAPEAPQPERVPAPVQQQSFQMSSGGM